MKDYLQECVQKLSLSVIDETVDAEPKVEASQEEIKNVLNDLYVAVDKSEYIPQTPTEENPALSDDYIFDTKDQNFVLKDLEEDNFVAKIKDISKGAERRRQKGLPQEYLYVFKYACKLMRRDAAIDESEDVLIYIKINNRKVPYKKFLLFHFIRIDRRIIKFEDKFTSMQ